MVAQFFLFQWFNDQNFIILTDLDKALAWENKYLGNLFISEKLLLNVYDCSLLEAGSENQF